MAHRYCTLWVLARSVWCTGPKEGIWNKIISILRTHLSDWLARTNTQALVREVDRIQVDRRVVRGRTVDAVQLVQVAHEILAHVPGQRSTLHVGRLIELYVTHETQNYSALFINYLFSVEKYS